MSKQINFLLLLAIVTVFAACNNANKPTEEVKEQKQEEPAMSVKEMAISDIQKEKDSAVEKKSIASKSTVTKKQVDKKIADNTKLQDLNSTTTVRTSNSTAPMSDADRLRQKAAEQRAAAQNPSNNSTVDKTTNKKPRANVKNTKVATPTVETPTMEPAKVEVAGAPSHDDWNTLLTQNVSNSGNVNYKGFRGAQSKLNAYLDKLKANPPVGTWSRNEKMAYWINAYNAFTIKKIVDNYPLGSIQELSGGKVWDDKFINIGDKIYSLNEIENGILRPTYKDARIHFAVNCAAKSCPSLHNRAFTAGNLESKLAQLTKKFVNNADFNTITAEKVTVSKIFDWYGSDFGDLKGFLNKYSNTPINDDAAIDYTEYNWSLNE